ncbi:hypothetical protein JIN85_10480 [Luteolibacter pohnpeiensis]|uniref:Uncharacterized protein n=1 Tax=Luteolibacter pohnpeiensis TaxID=454153 RepID=A0A934SCP7_9BACT|nr:hypothetical protein [Luteolibacter pohnpeiensis]MBK1882843.1 hypothetical protein [Luteolibacter pohnpeiensis]
MKSYRTPRRSKRASWLVCLLTLVSIGLWLVQQFEGSSFGKSQNHFDLPHSAPEEKSQAAESAEHVGGYEVYRGCQLLEHHSNDGDSFLVLLPDGRQKTLRLYFVDAPESAFRRYRNGETNFKRIQSQARDMGNLTPEQTVEIGQKAKNFSLNLLSKRPFTIYTRWDSPFHDDRFHAFVEVSFNGKSRWLHELLLERNMARILTKPADLPDGTKAQIQLARLRKIAKDAKH